MSSNTYPAYDWNAPHEVAHDVTHGQCTACSLTVGVVGGFIPAKCSACGGVIAPVAIAPITGAVPEYVVAEVAQAHALDPRARPHDAMIWLADENKRLADRLDAREREIESLQFLLDATEVERDRISAAAEHERTELTARAEQAERERDALRNAGAQLSNVAYNLAQRDTLDDGVRATMRQCYQQWDAATAVTSSRGSADHAK